MNLSHQRDYYPNWDVAHRCYWVNGIKIPKITVLKYKRTPVVLERDARDRWLQLSHFQTRFERVL